MKKILFILIVCWPLSALGQSFVNPDTIQQSGNIYLQNTDVYYCPFAPPTYGDTRAALCNQSDQLLDPNGVGNYWRLYLPVLYDTVNHTDTSNLQYWHPCGSGRALGPTAVWQRLFQARNKPDGSPSDIIVGDSVIDTTSMTPLGLVGKGSVIISKNEDVDFRATGTIKMENGFHVKPGAFFHAYQEPKWDTAVFSDEFDDTAKFHNQWLVPNGYLNEYGYAGQECVTDSNVYLDTDYQAHDGHALDIIMRVNLDTFYCDSLLPYIDTNNCTAFPDTFAHAPHKSSFSSEVLLTCPFPYSSTTKPLGGPAYAHAPYGKYEIRDKIPHVYHHTNNWGGSWDLEYDMNETDNGDMGVVHPNWNHHFRFGPCTGFFRTHGSTNYFISHDAGWNWQKGPINIIINNFLYNVTTNPFSKDTAIAASETQLSGGFPSSLVSSHDTFSFYYERWNWITADTVTWTVDGTGRIFSAPYKTSPGDSLFTRNYQPTQLTLNGHRSSGIGDSLKTHACHWVDSANDPINYGKIYLDDPVISTDYHSYTEAYSYQVPDLYAQTQGYPVPPVMIDADTASTGSTNDTAAYALTPYRYHTFAMEWLPHEVRFLIDSVVVRRIPDRLIPPGNPYYDWATQEARSPAAIHPAEFDIDFSSSDPFGNSITDLEGLERYYFETHPNNPGCWPVTIGGHTYNAAHHLVDYVKVWDVPADQIIPPFPH